MIRGFYRAADMVPAVRRPARPHVDAVLLWTVALAALAGCGRGGTESGAAPAPGRAPALARGNPAPGFAPARTRGYILISIDTLRADHLGAWGYDRPTSPFLDRLAARATLFERAFVQIPSTLPSHMTMFTGLYPGEHGVYPPSGILAKEIPTLPEAFRAAGYKTSGHSEGGYVQGGYGFARGFDEWTNDEYRADTDVERTLGRGLDFLSRLAPGEKFFLFLHTYSVHDPYAPPAEYRALFWPGAPPAGAFSPVGENFASFNVGRLAADAAAVDYYRALYDASIRYVDSQLERFFAELERLGLADQTTVIVTSDHGEEFREHGRLVHTQIYPECLHVPLLVVHPAQKSAARVGAVVRAVDLFPTLAELAGLAAPVRLSGASLVPLLRAPDAAGPGEAYAEGEMLGGTERTLIRQRERQLWQLVWTAAEQEVDGFWVSREVRFDAVGAGLDLRAVAFHAPRRLAVMVDGEARPSIELGTDWRPVHLALGGERKHAVVLSTPDCVSPYALGQGKDARCLSFKLAGIPLERVELYDLAADPAAAHDRSGEGPPLLRELLARLRGIRHRPLAAAGQATLTEEQKKQLCALGYLCP
ncbi:MAG: sulfatase [Thermoanaerobaculia bacterium]